MGRLYIPSQNEIDGPWLLSHENLKTLNDLFNETDQKLKDALTKTIEFTAKQQIEDDNQSFDLSKRIAKLQRKYSQRTKFAEVTFSDGSTYKADDIEGIINYVDSHPAFAPEELYIKTKQGSYENEFDLIINSNAKDQEVEFEYRIKCIDEEIQQKIKTLIDKWVRDNKPNKFLQIWYDAVKFVLFITGKEKVIRFEKYYTEWKTETSRLNNQIETLHNSISMIQTKAIEDNDKINLLNSRRDLRKIFPGRWRLSFKIEGGNRYEGKEEFLIFGDNDYSIINNGISVPSFKIFLVDYDWQQKQFSFLKFSVKDQDTGTKVISQLSIINENLFEGFEGIKDLETQYRVRYEKIA